MICGKLILGPENTKILGGGLDESNGVPPLPTLATRAARPSSRVDDPSHSGSMLHGTDTVQASNQGKSLCSRLDYINACLRKGRMYL